MTGARSSRLPWPARGRPGQAPPPARPARGRRPLCWAGRCWTARSRPRSLTRSAAPTGSAARAWSSRPRSAPGTFVLPAEPPNAGQSHSRPREPGGFLFLADPPFAAAAEDAIWLQNWQVLVPFPPPPVRSLFTYSFRVQAVDNLFNSGGGQIMSFVSLGGTPDLTTGEAVPVDIDAGWPIAANLGQPAPLYNGTYGTLDGQVTVQRSFLVLAGQVPGVAVVLGAAAALDIGTQLDLGLAELGASGIAITSDPPTGLISYSYEPQLVIAP